MPLDKLIKMSKEVAEPCVWNNRMLTRTLLISVATNLILVWAIL